MKLATFTDGNGARIGIVVGELVIDLSAAAPELPTDMTAFLAAGDAAMDRAREVQDDADHALPVDNVEFLAPVPGPGQDPRHRPQLRRPHRGDGLGNAYHADLVQQADHRDERPLRGHREAFRV